jgi:biopolymer transport protein ExbD
MVVKTQRGRERPEGRGDTVHFRPTRKYRRARGMPFAINYAPMIDVTFLLLIFFLVTTTFERAEGILSSRLPRDTGAPTVPLPISPIVVRLNQTGPEIDDYNLGIDNIEQAPADFHELTVLLGEIQTKPGFDDETPVVIVADSKVRWDHVVDAWNAAVRCRYKNIAFGGS